MDTFLTLLSHIASILSIISFGMVWRVNSKVSAILQRRDLREKIDTITSTLDGYIIICARNPSSLNEQELLYTLSELKNLYSNSYKLKTKLYFNLCILLSIKWKKHPHQSALIHCLATLKSTLLKEADQT